jgi:hypothetical protein
LQPVLAAKWLDKHACDDGQGKGGGCGVLVVGGGRAEVEEGWRGVVWVVNDGEWIRFGRRAMAGWVGVVVETFTICLELSNRNTCS